KVKYLNFTNKELIIFDLDGTLIDSVPDLASSVNHTLKSLNLDVFPEDTIRTWVGNGAATLVKRALSKGVTIKDDIDEDLFSNALDIFLNYYSNNLTVSTILYKGVKQTLESLQNKNYRLAIVTNKPFDFIEPILECLELSDLFEYYIGGDSLSVKKPNPMPLLHVCEKLNVNVESSLMIGDSKNDIVAANEANMDSIALSYGYNYDEDISIYNPNIVFDNFADIDKVL
ncbi:MAG: phosphoglycolate phosphatase, partial [Campylobacterota bacterium]|nr:phosphoglycolate phosphatase [Campylobacterota bacterium]